jgi:hypothetical protein
LLTFEELNVLGNNELIDVFEARLRLEALTDAREILADEAKLAVFRENQQDLTRIRNELFRRLTGKK